MIRRYLFTSLAMILLTVIIASLYGCSPLYVMRAAYEEGKILLAREEIEPLLASGELDEERATKLSYVLKAREFSEEIGLDAGDSYTMYSEVDKDVLAWVLLASEKDAFVFHTWWFPIVGTVPYKGFFEKEHATCEQKHLERKGYETWLRGTEAISTLGWFNDPILSTALKHSVPSVVNTVIHEIFHQTVWIPGSVDFNESAANFVGTEGALDFFNAELKKCEDDACREKLELYIKEAEYSLAFEYELGEILTELFTKLSTLYSEKEGDPEILSLREDLFHEIMAPFLEKYPEMKALRSPNNAEIMQLYLYRRELPAFRELFLRCEREWSCFLSALHKISESTLGEGETPYTELPSFP